MISVVLREKTVVDWRFLQCLFGERVCLEATALEDLISVIELNSMLLYEQRSANISGS